MKKYSLFALLILITLSFTSCSVFSPNITNFNENSTQVVLSKKNFNIVSNASASATASYLFGLGGIGKNGLVAHARGKLYDAVELKGSQVVINEHVEFKNSNIIPFIWYSTTVTISGVVIEFTE